MIMLEDQTKNQKSSRTVIGGILLSLFSILAQYDLPLMSYGFVALLIYCVCITYKKISLMINKPMMVFVAFALVHQFTVYVFSDTLEKNINNYLFMAVCMFILMTVCNVNKEDFLKAYYIVGMICSAIVIYQFILANFIGIPQSSIQILPVAEENQHFWIGNSSRVSGVFTEPQGFSSYILPLLVVLIFRYKFVSAIFVSLAIFSSSSSQGIILAAIVWIYYLVVYEKKVVLKVLRILLIAAVGITGLVVLSRIPKLSFIIEKILSINIFTYDIRLTKGFQIFFAMPFADKIVGIGTGNLRGYLLNGNFDFFWMPLTRYELFDYITTMSNVLVSFGVFGFLLYLNIFRKNCKNINEIAKMVLLLIFISSFSQTILFNAWFVFYWAVFEIYDDKNNKNYLRLVLFKRKNII